MINFSNELPYKNSYPKNQKSIMNPMGENISWPQLVAEWIFFYRWKLLPDYKSIKLGPDWYKPIMGPVRQLNQQSTVICNYFPNIQEEPLVIVAFKNFFKKNRPLTLGGYRKTRITKNGKLNITQAEKDCVIGIWAELDQLIKQRDIMKESLVKTPIKPIEELLSFQENTPQKAKKGTLAHLIELEKQLDAAKSD